MIVTTLHVSFVTSPVHPSILLPVSVSGLLVSTVTVFDQLSHATQPITHVIRISPVVHAVTVHTFHSLSPLVATGVLLVTANHAGYTSRTITSSASLGPEFP